MKKRLKIEPSALIHPPGFFRMIRDGIAPYNRSRAARFLRGLGFGPTDARFLANPKNAVAITEEGEALVVEFTTPSRRKATA